MLSCLLLGLLSNAYCAPLRLATGEYAPFTGESIPGQGMSSEVVKAVFKEINTDITLEFLPWNRLMNNLKSGAVAGSFPWKESEERKAFLNYSEPIHKYSTLLYMKNDNPFLDKSIAKKNLCVPEGWDPAPYEALIKKYEIKLTKPMSIESCFQMLVLNRVDMIFLNEYVGVAAVKRIFGNNPPVKGVMTDYFPKENYLYFVSPKNYPGSSELIAKFNDGLQKIKKNGVYGDILKKYKLSMENSRENTKSNCETCNRLGFR